MGFRRAAAGSRHERPRSLSPHPTDVRPRRYGVAMGEVVSLDRHRRERDERTQAFCRLDVAVQRLDPLVRRRIDRLTPTIRRELVAIARAVSAGSPSRAAERAERLAGLLEHPVASG